MIIIKGVAASPGIAIGKAYVLEDEEIVVTRQDVVKEKVASEVKRFKKALERTHRDLDAAEERVLKMLGKDHAKLIDAHRIILKDPLITKDIPKRIQTERINAEFALSQTLENVNQAFEKIEDEFFRERRHDIFDVGKRLLGHLLKQEKLLLSEVGSPAILIARNLLPSDTLHLREAQVLGFATDLGGKTSHTAILAQSMEIPAVVGLSDVSHQVRTGDNIILDGEQGLVIINPGEDVIAKYEKLREKVNTEAKALEVLRDRDSATEDGVSLSLMANLDTPDELKQIVYLKAQGIGLFRTEYLYMNRPQPPEEDEQVANYAYVVKALAPLPVIIRTADVGGDRLTRLGIEAPSNEANPFMGLRGIRLFLRHPDILKTQFRAILKASTYGNVKILLPMISSVGELRTAKRILQTAKAELNREGVEIAENVEMGIMVEIPAAAMVIEALLEEADFVSIGTNDLIQYTLAVDRINEHVAYLYDPFHPAVLRLLKKTVDTIHEKGRWVSVCGEMASDPRAIPLLIGMGVDAYSVSPRMLLRIKQVLRSSNKKKLEDLVEEALLLGTSEEIQKLLQKR